MVAARAAAGTAGGILVWIAIAAVTRAAAARTGSPAFSSWRKTLAQAALAAILPITLMPRYGANGGLASLACFGVLAMALPSSCPTASHVCQNPKLAKPACQSAVSSAWPRYFSIWPASSVLWVFVEQIGTGAKIAANIVGFAVAAALAAQVTGSASPPSSPAA